MQKSRTALVRLFSCILSLLCQERVFFSVQKNAGFASFPRSLAMLALGFQRPLARWGRNSKDRSFNSRVIYRVSLTPFALFSMFRLPLPNHFTPYAAATTAIAHRLSLPRQSPIGRRYIAYKKVAHTALAAFPLLYPHTPYAALYRAPPVSAIYPATPSESDKPCPLASLPARTHYRANRWYPPSELR